MAKKQKRQVSTSAAPVVRERPESEASPVASYSTPAASRYPVSSSRTSSSSYTEFKPDYSHVIKDLKRIGALAGSFVVILVVLSFILK